MTDISDLTTEERNAGTMNLDIMSLHEAIQVMNHEDQLVATAVSRELDDIEEAIKHIITSFKSGGRLVYIGAGTSGRLGVLDAAECVPTFGVDAGMVVGLIAGGTDAVTTAVEGAEDSWVLGRQDLQAITLTANDTVVGLAASGRTPYVMGALEYANTVGAYTISLALNKHAQMSQYAKTAIEVDVGPEILTGSTRLKSGTAQKMILNMLSTLSMVGIGKAYQNLMVDVKPTNEKLIERAKRIIMEATGSDYNKAEQAFKAADGEVKIAIIMILTGVNKEEAKQKLIDHDGTIRKAI